MTATLNCNSYWFCYFSSSVIDFGGEQNGTFCDNHGDTQFRGLSTKSSVQGAQKEKYLTEWKWYWKEKDGFWKEYADGVNLRLIDSKLNFFIWLTLSIAKV